MLTHRCLVHWVKVHVAFTLRQLQRLSTVARWSLTPCAGWACRTPLALRRRRAQPTISALWNIESSFRIPPPPGSSQLPRKEMGAGAWSSLDCLGGNTSLSPRPTCDPGGRSGRPSRSLLHVTNSSTATADHLAIIIIGLWLEGGES